MAHATKALQRYHETHYQNSYISWFHYVTDDTQAEVETAGYFNASVETLKTGDIIEAVVDADGTQAFVRVRVTAATIGSDVTVAALA